MRALSIAILATLLAGCSDVAYERKFSAMPEELSDCRVFYVRNSSGNSMTVVRCPNSAVTTSVKSGKTKKTTVTIDGVAYAPVQDTNQDDRR